MRDRRTLYVAATLLAAVALSAGPVHAVTSPSATISNLLASCKGNKVCFGFDVVTTDFGASGQDIAVDLINANTNTVQETLTEHLTADTTHVADCFKTSVPAKFTVKIRVPAGGNLNLSGTLTTDILSCGTTTTTTLDHFQCYELKPATIPPTTVTVEDQFGTQKLTLRFPHRLCAPAEKNQEPVFDPVQHLVAYDTLRTPFTKQTGLSIANQFGTTTIDLTRRDLLMVPTAKSLMAPPPPLQPPTIDHFQCYRAKRSAGSPKFVKTNVTVADRFESLNPSRS